MSTFFFPTETATTMIYTLSLHDALPICHKNPHNRDDAHQLEEREATLTSRDTSSHPTRPPGWPRPGHTHRHRTRTTHREDPCSTVTASRPSRSAGPPGSSAGSV